MNKYNRHRISLVLLLLVGMLTGGPRSAMAVRPDAFKDTLSDSRPSVTAVHTISYDQAAGSTFQSAETFILTMTSDFNPSSITASDITWTDNAVSKTIGADCSSTNLSVTASSTALTFTACGTYTGTAGSILLITIGNSNKITNPAANVYTITADTTDEDAQATKVAIVAGVTITAKIAESLSFSVNAVTDANCPTTGGTKINTTSTAIDYSTGGTVNLNADAFYDGCQDLRVGTNAANGYVTTVQTVQGMDSGATAFAKGNCDGSCTLTTPEAWATANNNGYAVCMKDQATFGDAAATANLGWDTAAEQCGGAGQKFELVADISLSEVASDIMKSTTGVSDDRIMTGWRISADALQAAGTYTGTAVYIATPTF